MPQIAAEHTTPRVSIIVPTYREAENLPRLIARISAVLEAHEITAELLLMDDDSQDGSEELVEALRLPWVRMIVRKEERGLSQAVLEGVRQARGAALLVMDADLSHPPEKIPELLEAIDEGYDFVIGSRHVKGATTDENWGAFRWLNSFAATMLAKPFISVRDPMSGFFAFPRRTLDRADYLNPIGYKIGLELLVKCRCQWVKEIAIHFANRELGASKLCLKEQLLYIQHIRRLFIYKFGGWADLAQFLIVGLSGVFVNLIVLTALLWRDAPRPAAVASAILISMLTNFFLNRRFTFSYARKGPLFKQLLRFCAACSLGALVNWGATLLILSQMPGLPPQLGALCGIFVGTLLNFIASRYLVFTHDSL